MTVELSPAVGPVELQVRDLFKSDDGQQAGVNT